jgi:signal transduction histidine kinase
MGTALRSLRLLVVEDTEDDWLLLARELARLGYSAAQAQRVCTADDLRRALDEPLDLVISDWSMPTLNGLQAYEIVRERDPDLPFIMVSGTIGEEVAVDALRAGVDDFMSKGRFARLGPSIERALRAAEFRRKQRIADRELEAHREAVEQSERLLRSVLDSVKDPVLVVDRDRRILTSNPVAFDVFTQSKPVATLAEFRQHWTFYAPDQVTPLGDDGLPYAKAMRGTNVDAQEIFARNSLTGASHIFLGSAQRLPGSDIVVGMMRDITREREAQEQVMVSDRMASVGMLAAGVAHEINNPLAAALANLELMSMSFGAEGVAPDEAGEFREMLDDARVAVERVRQIVRDLKIFSRHEEPLDGVVDVGRTLESTLRMAWNEIRHRATLVKEIASTPPVLGSESRLGQVFLNLIVNAAQAIPEGRAQNNTIRVKTFANGPHVVVEISDTGCGMSPETLPKLFTPFFTTKPQGEGTGLGLAIVYRIVTGLNGTIDVTSEPGQGSTFRVTLPAAVASPTVSRTVSTTVGTPARRRGRILVVDDDAIVGNSIRRMLSAQHDVETTTRARDALDRIRNGERFDVIVCDLMMPEMTGVQLHAELRALEHADRMVFLTGGAFTSEAQAFLATIENPQLEKPFDVNELKALISERLASGS